MSKQADPRLADPKQAEIIRRMNERKAAIAALTTEMEEDWPLLLAMINAQYGEDQPVTLVVQDPPLKAGRYFATRGAGHDPTELAIALKAALKSAEYKAMVTEEKTTVYHVNESAIKAAATVDSRVAKAVKDTLRQGKEVHTRIPPEEAKPDELAIAVAYMPMKQAERSRA